MIDICTVCGRQAEIRYLKSCMDGWTMLCSTECKKEWDGNNGNADKD
ncbi:MAG: hypothetical protein Sv326_0444 [Candidatus Fermentimicrarchaeum limneticum]|uniref:TRASH domain-containing protein n=1 Tax=Fermentimicrarchaeum limneticum TaxID=2795018 RepID=A0A7D6BBX1_FERL1|nr:MAG: hypothetical protein Sv326_0370 [Candidatus Fermentimicrarchaeum limneticum]QLJ52582.1 MAG: hypothetical protein Sv326_0407 [Candidatus Fermentimicrarchaeum limneticum]QLJ52619.1 MAG: hypothetical protein Sv326_0444 [Candidatus Fermentimicrarchaeum limneticum]